MLIGIGAIHFRLSLFFMDYPRNFLASIAFVALDGVDLTLKLMHHRLDRLLRAADARHLIYST